MNLNVSVAADLALHLAKVLEACGWQWQECWPFILVEDGEHLPLGRAVDPPVGDPVFPREEVVVLLREARE